MRPYPQRHPARPASLRRFGTDEAGTMAVFSVFVFVAMLMVAGLAIDLMRHENERLRMQGTADRAVLAATMLRENVSGATPEQILTAYFAAEGLEAQLGTNFSVEEDPEVGRTVTVVPAATVPSLFMRLVGVEDFAVATPAQATEAVGGGTRLDLVMVLDVSGSMNGQGKIGAMQTAAVNMVNSLLADAEPGMVSVTLVPYDTYVLPPAGFLNHFTSLLGFGACNDWTLWTQITGSLSLPGLRQNCNTATWRTVRPFLGDAASAASYINGLQASGTTSIDLGVRYGALFFDPSVRPAITELIANGTVSSDFAGRPFDWDEGNVVRAMILLTDGQNCCGERFPELLQNSNTTSVCESLRDRGVLIYSIAFEAPANGAALMQSCASSASHYFNANVDEIIDVFEGIGNSIQTQALRLTL